MRRYVAQCDVVPALYGIAWYDYARNCAVCYPLGLNKVFGLLRSLYFALFQSPGRQKQEWLIDSRAYERGYKAAQDHTRSDAEFRINRILRKVGYGLPLEINPEKFWTCSLDEIDVGG